MCVRELRKTDTANVSVFYLSLCSTIGASVGLGVSVTIYGEQFLMMPHRWEWALFAGIGKLAYASVSFHLAALCPVPYGIELCSVSPTAFCCSSLYALLQGSV